jgi:hypothetical protein
MVLKAKVEPPLPSGLRSVVSPASLFEPSVTTAQESDDTEPNKRPRSTSSVKLRDVSVSTQKGDGIP